MAKSTKIIAALGVAAGLGVAAMPLASYAVDDEHNITDTINVTVSPLCIFQADTDASGAATATGGSYTKTIANGVTETVGTHFFNVRCNNNTGYAVKAYATGLSEGTTGEEIDFVVANDFATKIAGDNKASGAWTAIVDDKDSGNASTMIAAGTDLTGAHTIISKSGANNAIGERFKVEYKAYIGDDTQAGTYAGTVVYNLAAN